MGEEKFREIEILAIRKFDGPPLDSEWPVIRDAG
jgi:hypothetical protein